MRNRAGLCVMSSNTQSAPLRFHLAVDRPGHDVARGQRLEGMVAPHEFLPVHRLEHTAFAPHRLRDKE